MDQGFQEECSYVPNITICCVNTGKRTRKHVKTRLFVCIRARGDGGNKNGG